MIKEETIHVETEDGKELKVVVTEKKTDAIWIALGEGIHNVKCRLVPARNGLAYVGTVMGRELVYRKSVQEVRRELESRPADRKPVKR